MQMRLWWGLVESAFGRKQKYGVCRVRQSDLYWCIWKGCGFSHHEDVFTFNFVEGHKLMLAM
jgi:hypothetical protein